MSGHGGGGRAARRRVVQRRRLIASLTKMLAKTTAAMVAEFHRLCVMGGRAAWLHVRDERVAEGWARLTAGLRLKAADIEWVAE